MGLNGTAPFDLLGLVWDQFVLELVRQGCSLPLWGIRLWLFPLSRLHCPDCHSNDRLLGRGIVPPQEGGRRDCQFVLGPGGIYSHYFMASNFQTRRWSLPHCQHQRAQHISSCFQVSHTAPRFYSSGSTPRLVHGWCRWIWRMPICMC